jgi:hypothetical protein
MRSAERGPTPGSLFSATMRATIDSGSEAIFVLVLALVLLLELDYEDDDENEED